ncbi:hypothetical protein E2562_036051 [Oryza meyeriana var. granulata]|uniref:Uncharacterized protein n=1 Tax=Oryza meyeriana var. granulata TaxID=110450 RepID=A0A6G1DAG7_9ORYZ|nr:hypothetical protein E2562_036051 [Oryza meyeriana var. granulata]
MAGSLSRRRAAPRSRGEPHTVLVMAKRLQRGMGEETRAYKGVWVAQAGASVPAVVAEVRAAVACLP